MSRDSYVRHKQEEQTLADHDDAPWCYRGPNSIGYWHHERMLKSLGPLLKYSQNKAWMTVGDGRFGSDAHFLKSCGLEATATSISDATLKIAKNRGWIDNFSEENAENLSFEDETFDYVLCKETYHHFPRPAVGFYEMLRVARCGVVLVEPAEGVWSPLSVVKRAVKRLLRRDHSFDLFEPSGNFVFRISKREIKKMMTAMGYRVLAWKGMNTFWYAPFDAAEINQISVPWVCSRLGIFLQDAACRLHLLHPGLATVVCFKQKPPAGLLSELHSDGFEIIFLPENPYYQNSCTTELVHPALSSQL